MGPLSQPPRDKQLWRLRGALAVSLVLNALALALLVARPTQPPPTPSPGTPGGAGPTPSATPPVSIGPIGGPTGGPAGGTQAGGPPVPSPTPVRVAHPGGKIRGVNIPVWGPDFAVADPSIRGAAALDANWVALVSHWYVSSGRAL